MRRFIVIFTLTALVLALSPIHTPAFAANTLDALPVWNVPYMIVHAEDIPKVLSRLGNSFLFETALDHTTREYVDNAKYTRRSHRAPTFARYTRWGFNAWVRNSPVESLSFAMGLQWPNIGTFFGAIRFSSDKQEFLTQLSSITDGDGAGEKLKDTVLNLFGVPNIFFLRSSEFSDISISLSIEGVNLYRIGLFYTSVEKEGDESILLFGSNPELVERCRKALKGEVRRMEITRRGAVERKVFAQIRDTKNDSLSKSLPRGVFPEFKTPVFLELSLGLEERKVEFSLHHNFIDVFLGDINIPASEWSTDDPGLKFGGGRPWLTGLFSTNLTEDDIYKLLPAMGVGSNEALKFLGEFNINVSTLTKAFRSLGFVLGGKSTLFRRQIPGGYVFISGGADEMRSLSPLIRAFIENSNIPNEEVSREGWDVFYTFYTQEEHRARFGMMPMFAGVKDGTMLLGILAPETLDEEPEIMWSAVNEKDALRINLNADGLRTMLSEVRSSLVNPDMLTSVIYSLDLKDVLNEQALTALVYTLLCAQEVKEVSFSGDWHSYNLTFFTGEVDYKQVWELVRIVREPKSSR